MPAEAEYRQQIILWITMLVSIGMYFVVVRSTPVPDVTGNPILVNILLTVSLGLAGASFLLRVTFWHGHVNWASRNSGAQDKLLHLCFASLLLCWGS